MGRSLLYHKPSWILWWTSDLFPVPVGLTSHWVRKPVPGGVSLFSPWRHRERERRLGFCDVFWENVAIRQENNYWTCHFLDISVHFFGKMITHHISCQVLQKLKGLIDYFRGCCCYCDGFDVQPGTISNLIKHGLLFLHDFDCQRLDTNTDAVCVCADL